MHLKSFHPPFDFILQNLPSELLFALWFFQKPNLTSYLPDLSQHNFSQLVNFQLFSQEIDCQKEDQMVALNSIFQRSLSKKNIIDYYQERWIFRRARFCEKIARNFCIIYYIINNLQLLKFNRIYLVTEFSEHKYIQLEMRATIDAIYDVIEVLISLTKVLDRMAEDNNLLCSAQKFQTLHFLRFHLQLSLRCR